MKRKCIAFCLAAALFVICYPVVFLAAGSLMGGDELLENLSPVMHDQSGGFAKWSLLPRYPTLRSYVEVLLDSPAFFVMFWNSIKIAVGVLAGQLLVAVPAAWGFTRYEFAGKKLLFSLYIVFMLLPFQVLMLSEYLVLYRLSLLNTLWAVILPGIFSTFPVFVLYNFFRGIPDQIVEAARLDGASELQIFLRIGVPMGMPGIAAVLILQFLEYWNLVEQPMLFLEDARLWTLPLYLPDISLERAGFSLAAAVITLIPSLLVFFAGQDGLERGIAATAVKE